MSKTKTSELERQARQKERGLWSFLTWSFFLSQVITDGPFTGAAVASSANVEETSEHGNAARQSSVQPPMGRGSGSDLDGGEGANGAQPVSAVAASQLALPDINAHALSHFTGIDVAGDNSPRQLGVMGASGGSHVASASDQEAEQPPANSPDDSGTGGGSGIDLPGVLSPIGSGVVELIDDLLDPPLSAIGGVVGDLTDSLTGTIDDVMSSLQGATDLLVNSIDLLPKTLDAVLSTTLPGISALAGETIQAAVTPLVTTLEEVTDGLPNLIGLDELVGGDLVSAPGQILFKPLSIGGDLLPDLFSKGKYTDYNLALRADQGGDTQGHASVATASSSTLLDSLLSPDVPDASDAQGGSHSSATPVHVIDDIGRSLDWLIH